MASLSEVLAILIKADGSSAVGAFDKVGDAAKRNLTDAQQHSDNMGKNLQKAGVVAAGAGAAILAGFGVAVAAASRFDQQMSEVGAVSNATGGQLDRLSKAALDAGKATAFSATEAAQAEAELSKAGISTADILGGALRGALDLAAAGTIELSEAATIAAQAMNIFNLQGNQVGHVADVLAAGANKSAADVSQLGQALQQGGLLAKQTGLSLEETVGTLALFADNALVGSDAGTSLKTMLQRLTPQSAEAAAKMDELGISAYDSHGGFIGLDKFAANLRDSLGGLTAEQRNTALATIFGSDAVRGANILYEAGGKGVRAYTRAVDDQGAAADTAGKKMDNLAGDLEKLKGSIETALIGTGSKGTGPLRALAQSADGAVTAFTELPEGVQSSVFAIGAVTGVALVAGGALTVVAGSALRAHVAMQQLAVSSPAAAAGLSKLGTVGLVAGGAALTLELRNLNKSLLESVLGSERAAQGIQILQDGFALTRGDVGPFVGDVVDLGKGFLGMGDEGDKAAEKTKKLKDQLTPAAQEAKKLADMQTAAQTAVDKYGLSSDQAQQAIGRYRDATSTATAAQDQFTIATTDAKTALDNLKNASLGAFGAQLSYAQAQQANTQAVTGVATAQQALNDAIAEYGPSSQQAADAQAQLSAAQLQAQQANYGLVTASFDLQAQMQTLEDQVRNGNTTAVDELIGKLQAEAAQHPETAATINPLIYQLEVLKQKYGQIPATKNTTVWADTSQAHSALDYFTRRWSQPLTVPVIARMQAGTFGGAMGGAFPGRASGGDLPAGPFWVGERGPELIDPGFNGRVLSKNDSMNSLRGGRGGGAARVVHIENINVVSNDGQAVVKAIRQYERESGAGWRDN